MQLDDWFDTEILSAIKGNDFDSEILKSVDCWKEICRVRGLNLGQVSESEWKALCKTRGEAFVTQDDWDSDL